MRRITIRNRSLFALVVLMRASPWLGFVRYSHTPLQGMQRLSVADTVPAPSRAAIGVLVALLLVCVWLPPRRSTWGLQCGASLLLMPLLLLAFTEAGQHMPAGTQPTSRIMPGAGFWWLEALSALAVADAIRHLGGEPPAVNSALPGSQD